MMIYSIQDFVQLIAQLRHPTQGCPWDIKQTYDSMIPCLTEETYEVIDAIAKKDVPNLREELGDLLLQVVFLSQLATEDGHFTFDDVVHDVVDKIIRRHPHVFGDQKANNEAEALDRWNAMKAKERSEKGQNSIFDNVPSAFPALIRAEKLQKRCAKVGFDWDSLPPVAAKVEEELAEVLAETQKPTKDQAKIEEEIGDLLFATVNLARHLKCQPEESLRKANLKFESRFRKIEEKASAQNKDLASLSLEEMDAMWNAIKQEESN